MDPIKPTIYEKWYLQSGVAIVFSQQGLQIPKLHVIKTDCLDAS